MEEECLLEQTFHVQLKNLDSDNLNLAENSQNCVNDMTAVLNGSILSMTSSCQVCLDAAVFGAFASPS
jgi:hypothetical protein